MSGGFFLGGGNSALANPHPELGFAVRLCGCLAVTLRGNGGMVSRVKLWGIWHMSKKKKRGVVMAKYRLKKRKKKKNRDGW